MGLRDGPAHQLHERPADYAWGFNRPEEIAAARKVWDHIKAGMSRRLLSSAHLDVAIVDGTDPP